MKFMLHDTPLCVTKSENRSQRHASTHTTMEMSAHCNGGGFSGEAFAQGFNATLELELSANGSGTGCDHLRRLIAGRRRRHGVGVGGARKC